MLICPETGTGFAGVFTTTTGLVVPTGSSVWAVTTKLPTATSINMIIIFV